MTAIIFTHYLLILYIIIVILICTDNNELWLKSSSESCRISRCRLSYIVSVLTFKLCRIVNRNSHGKNKMSNYFKFKTVGSFVK